MRAQERIRPLARQVGSRAWDADADGVQLAVERDPAQLDAAKQRFGVRNRGRACEDSCHGAFEREGAQHVRAEPAGQRAEDVAERRADNALERLSLIGVAAERAAESRMVEDEGDADDWHSPRDGALELEAKPPALRCRGLEQRVRTGGTQNLLARRA